MEISTRQSGVPTLVAESPAWSLGKSTGSPGFRQWELNPRPEVSGRQSAIIITTF